jgi:hypothetical protein
MKRSVFLRSVFAVAFCALIIEYGRSFSAGPFEFKPNWLTILPAIAMCAAFIGLLIRKELRLLRSGRGTKKLNWRQSYANAPLDELS